MLPLEILSSQSNVRLPFPVIELKLDLVPTPRWSVVTNLRAGFNIVDGISFKQLASGLIKEEDILVQSDFDFDSIKILNAT